MPENSPGDDREPDRHYQLNGPHGNPVGENFTRLLGHENILIPGHRQPNADGDGKGAAKHGGGELPFALENACALLSHQIPDGGMGQSVAIVDIGASSTTFSVLVDLKVVYTRDFAFGGQQLTEEIMRTYGLSMEDAGRAKKQGGLPSNYQPEVLEPFVDDTTQQVSRSLQFYLASGGGREQPDMILVCGGCANIPGIADVISSRVGIPTEVGDPLGQMKISSKAKSQGVHKDSTALLTACGLALRSFD